MKWTPEAEKAIQKVPFFVRKKVRERVEKEVRDNGREIVVPADLEAARRRFIRNMASEVKGYQADICFGPGGCPNRTVQGEQLLEKVDRLLEAADLLSFLKQQVKGDLKLHHEFRVSLAECPNACSQPQIKDIGLIGARRPQLTDDYCKQCGNCTALCPDEAVTMTPSGDRPIIDFSKCLACGQCIENCQTSAIVEQEKGWKVLLGGKLGRHPRLALEMPGIYNEEAVLKIITAVIQFYKENSKNGRRLAEILTPAAFDHLVKTAARFQFDTLA